MKTISLIMAFYMLLGAMFPRTDFSQLVHVPDLWEHYQEHKAESLEQGIDFSLIEFVNIHFFQPNEHQHDDQNKHQNLPFQSFQTSMVLLQIDINVEFKDIPFSFSSNFFDFKSVLQPKGFTQLPFQPPILS